MASITSWVRLEPRSRDADLLAGVEARLHDPLWLLARQWQLGELTGADAGSAILARTRADIARIDAIRGPGGDWAPFDPDTTPLTVALAPAPDEPSARPPLYRRARAGRHLLRLLAAAGLPDRDLFLTKFPLTVTDAERTTLDGADLRFLATMAGRAPDGDTAAATLGPLLPTATSQLPGDFGVPADRVGAVSDVCRAWLAWRAAFEHTSPSPAWQPDQLAYRFDARAAAASGDVVLTAEHLRGSAIRACDVDASPGDAAQREPVSIVSTSLPARARYRGMPARRYWELEDAAVHWPSIDAGPGDVARILFVEFGLAFGEHWLSVPLPVPAGSVSRVASLVVTDTFGRRTLVGAAADLDAASASSAWCFLELSRAGELAGPLVFVPPAAAGALGPDREVVDFARDDVSDVLWAVDRTILGGDALPRDIAPAPPAPMPPSSLERYQLGPDVDPAYHPYRPRIDQDGLVLALASIPDAPAAARPDLPSRVRGHALPSRALRLVTRLELARSPDGSRHVIEVHETAATAAPPNLSLIFDTTEAP
jgi:hypothetical protein